MCFSDLIPSRSSNEVLDCWAALGSSLNSVRVDSGVQLVGDLGVVNGLDAILAVVVVLVGVTVSTGGSRLAFVESMLVGRLAVVNTGTLLSLELLKGKGGEGGAVGW